MTINDHEAVPPSPIEVDKSKQIPRKVNEPPNLLDMRKKEREPPKKEATTAGEDGVGNKREEAEMTEEEEEKEKDDRGCSL